MIYTITLNPAIDRTIVVDSLDQKDKTMVHQTIRQAAGKGINVSYVLQTLGVKSVVVTLLGGLNGRFVESKLHKDGFKTMLLPIDGETRENIKIVSKHNAVWEINEPGPQVDSTILDALLDRLLPQLRSNDIVVLTGSLPPGLPIDAYRQLLDKLHEIDVYTILDTSGEALRLGLKAIPRAIKPNLLELQEYYGKELSTLEDIVQSATTLLQTGITDVLVSLGNRGSIMIHNTGIFYAPSIELNAINTVGAGDSFVAGFVTAFVRGDTPKDCLRYAAAVSSASVVSIGTGLSEHHLIDSLYEKINIRIL